MLAAEWLFQYHQHYSHGKYDVRPWITMLLLCRVHNWGCATNWAHKFSTRFDANRSNQKPKKKKGEAEGRKRYNGIHSRYIYGHPFCLVSDARERAQIESFLFLGKYCFAQRTQNTSTQSVRDRVGRVIVIEWRGWDADKHAFTLTDGEWQYHFVWTCLLKYLENISTTELCFSWRENKTKK